jgi:hypothetical protein
MRSSWDIVLAGIGMAAVYVLLVPPELIVGITVVVAATIAIYWLTRWIFR